MILSDDMTKPLLETFYLTAPSECRRLFDLELLSAEATARSLDDEQVLDLLLDKFQKKFVTQMIDSARETADLPTIKSMRNTAAVAIELFVAECYLVDLLNCTSFLSVANDRLYSHNCSPASACFLTIGICTEQFYKLYLMSCRLSSYPPEAPESEYGEFLLQVVQFLSFSELVLEGQS